MIPRARRPRSRTSTNSTSPSLSSDGMAPSSLTSGTSRTSHRTSTTATTWMDDHTAVPGDGDGDHDSYKYRGGAYVEALDEEQEELLIDMSDDAILPSPPMDHDSLSRLQTNESGKTPRNIRGRDEPSPAEKLKILLRQMDAEIRETTPVSSSIRAPEASTSASASTSGSRSVSVSSSFGGRRTTTRRQPSYDPIEQDEGRVAASASGSAWRNGRRRFTPPSHSGSQSGDPMDEEVDAPEEGDEEDEDEDSPPTPPRRFASTSQKAAYPSARIPTRAAVLQASTSRQAIHRSSSPVQSTPTPLENFIATTPAPRLSSLSSPTSSRKGKEPARFQSDDDIPLSPPSRRSRHSPRQESPHAAQSPKNPDKREDRSLDTSQDGSRDLSKTPGPSRRSIRYTHTPRRWSVELAPDPEEFAQHAEGLEIRGEVELDVEESEDPPNWDSASENGPGPNSQDQGPSRHRSPPQPDRTLRAVPVPASGTRPRQKFAPDSTSSPPRHPPSPRRGERNWSKGDGAGETSLPALPQPSDTDPETEEEEGRSISSRRAAMFRSPSKSSSSRMSSNRFENLSYSSTTATATAPAPVASRYSSPSEKYGTPRSAVESATERSKLGETSRNGTNELPTPHPPGKWYSPSRQKARFSPSLDRPDSTTHGHGRTDSGHLSVGSSSLGGEVSVHRIKLSPARPVRSSPRRSRGMRDGEDDEVVKEANSSFLMRLGLRTSPMAKQPTPHGIPRSETLAQAQEALRAASSASAAARLRVEMTQKQWLEALAAAQRVGDGAVQVTRSGWGWSTWAWWVCVEVLLVWGVFRVTLDYAHSTAFLSSLDPFSPNLSSSRVMSLSIPLPSAVSAFVIPHRGSANFFDLFENADLWDKLERWGIVQALVAGAEAGVRGGGGLRGGDGVRMLGGVPT